MVGVYEQIFDKEGGVEHKQPHAETGEQIKQTTDVDQCSCLGASGKPCDWQEEGHDMYG